MEYFSCNCFMFCGCVNLKELPDFSTWNTSCVCDMSYMFRECVLVDKIKNLDNFDMSKVTSISNLFYGCRNLNEVIGISEWNISKIIDMSHLFYDCIKSSLKNKLRNMPCKTGRQTNQSFAILLQNLIVNSWFIIKSIYIGN